MESSILIGVFVIFVINLIIIIIFFDKLNKLIKDQKKTNIILKRQLLNSGGRLDVKEDLFINDYD